MKVPFWGVALIVSLIISGPSAFAEEAATAQTSEPYLMPLNRNTMEYLREEKEQQDKAAEAKKAKEEEKVREQEKQAKIDKIERKTGRKVKSWQVLNR